jgi:hypothetical protein
MFSGLRHFIAFAAVGLVAVYGTGCDFGAAGDAFDDFDVIIGLEPINTVINGIVVDASTGELVDARLTFTGPDANVVIDAYSDPVDEVDAEGGTVTFGIANGVSPSVSNPVELTVLVQADGYFDRERSLVITEEGDAQFQANMTPRDVGNASLVLPGSSATSDVGANTDESSGMNQPLSLRTESQFAEASFSVPQFALPVDATGTPLSGPLVTQLRVFDGADGLRSLPSGALRATDGSQLSVSMAAFFRMSDGSGRVAVDFDAPAGSRTAASKRATACEDAGGTSLVLTSSESSFVASVQALGGAATAQIWAYTPADGANAEIGTVPVEESGGAVSGEVCLGGGAANVDPSLIGDASDGFFYTFAIDGGALDMGTLDHFVSISNPNGSSKQVTFALTGPGFSESSVTTVPVGTSSQPLSSLVGQGGSVNVLPGVDYVLSARLSTGETNVSTIGNPLSGSSSITIPETSALETYNLTASLSCENPETQKFEVRITKESLDAISVFYRENLSGNSWTLLPRKAITDKEATDASIEIQATLSLKPGTDYRVRGTLANNSAETIETTPATGGTWLVRMSTDEIGLDCKDR